MRSNQTTTLSQLIGLTVQPVVNVVMRRYWLFRANNAAISAAVEKQKAKEAMRNEEVFQKRESAFRSFARQYGQ